MIETTIWRKHLSFALLVFLCAVALAACTADSPVDPGGGGGVIIDPPPDGETGTVTLSWDRPVSNADGSGPLTDLVGYTVCYGTSQSLLNQCEDVGNVETAELEVPFGTYFFAVRAVDTWGNQSDFSNVIQITVEDPGSAIEVETDQTTPVAHVDAPPAPVAPTRSLSTTSG